MRKIIFPLIVIITIILISTCSNENFMFEDNSETVLKQRRALSLEAFMPEPNTRVDLKQKENMNISLTWEANDELQLAFVQGEIRIKKTVKVKNISDDGKKAGFNIDIPTEIVKDTSFDLYGVYGGGLSDANPTNVILPANSGNAKSLEDVKNRKDIVFYFASKNINTTNRNISVALQHLGSLFNITLKNTSTTKSLDNIQEARLVGIDVIGDGRWVCNSGNGGQIYDLIDNSFKNTKDTEYYISFKVASSSLASGETLSFWGWYPPLPDKNWPELKLELGDATATLLTSENSKPAKITLITVGNCYYLYAVWNGSKLMFTDESLTEISFPNPLERWATHNVGKLNEFATGDPKTTKGMLYQFGRNIPLPAEGEIEIELNISDPSDSRVWQKTSSLLTKDNTDNEFSGANWFSGSVAGLNSWENIVAKSVSDGAPTSYEGNNGGDPCPEGWHIPSGQEYYSLIYLSRDFLDKTENKIDVNEKVDVYGNGEYVHYTADYTTIDPITKVGVRFKDTPYSSAYMYKLVDYGLGSETAHIEVKSKLVDNEVAIDDVVSWTETDWSDAVIRYFPITGTREHIVDEKSPVRNRGTEVYYRVNSENNEGRSMSFYFRGYNRDAPRVDRKFGSGMPRGKAVAMPIRCVKDF